MKSGSACELHSAILPLFFFTMNKSDILNTFNKYSIFSDILSTIESDAEWGEMYLNNLVAMNFKGEVDLIMYVRNH